MSSEKPSERLHSPSLMAAEEVIDVLDEHHARLTNLKERITALEAKASGAKCPDCAAKDARIAELEFDNVQLRGRPIVPDFQRKDAT